MLKRLLEWDQEALIYLNNLGSESYDLFWLITTNFLTWIPLFLLISLLLCIVHGRKEGVRMLLSFVSMLAVLTIVILLTKQGIGRLRPVNDESLNAFLRVLTQPSDFSFFSGHAASSFSIATLAVLYLRKRLKWSYMLFVWPIVFSFSRMYLGVHYPLDIIVGTIVGILFAYLFFGIHQKFTTPYIR